MKCLVTGGAGFIGSHLTDYLINEGHEVIVLDSLFSGKREYINSKAEFIKADIRDFGAIRPIFEGVDCVFHMAALVNVQESIDDPMVNHDVNVNGIVNVLEASRLACVKKFIFSSTAAVYGNQESMPLSEECCVDPLSPYALHKYIGERYCRLYSELYGLSTACLRYFNVFGDRMPTEGGYVLVLGVFTRQLKNNESLTITGDGEQKRDYVFVGDIVSANIKAVMSEDLKKGEVINIGTGENYTINDLARAMGGPVEYIAPRIEVRESLANNEKAREVINWEPSINVLDWIPGYKKREGIGGVDSEL